MPPYLSINVQGTLLFSWKSHSQVRRQLRPIAASREWEKSCFGWMYKIWSSSSCWLELYASSIHHPPCLKHWTEATSMPIQKVQCTHVEVTEIYSYQA